MTKGYVKAHTIRIFKQEGVAVLRKIWESLDDWRVLERIHTVHHNHIYTVQIVHGILDKKFPTSQLFSLPTMTELDFSANITTKVTLASIVSLTSIRKELGLTCKCNKNCMFNRCVCCKAGTPCTDRCHEKGKGSTACQNDGVTGNSSRKRAGTTTQEPAEMERMVLHVRH